MAIRTNWREQVFEFLPAERESIDVESLCHELWHELRRFHTNCEGEGYM